MTGHPDYNLHSDLALVEVARPFELAPHIDTVCLPRPGQDFRGQVCTATGWGKDRWAGRLYCDLLGLDRTSRTASIVRTIWSKH